MPDAEVISPYALTALARVTDILKLPDTSFNTMLLRYINGATDFIERSCGKTGPERYPNDGHFVQKTYTREVYSVRGKRQQMLILRNAPVFWAVLTGTTTSGSAVMTGLTNTVGIAAGMPVIAQGIFPSTTTVVSTTATTVTMSATATASSSSSIVEISGLISFEWRAGTPSSPNWTAFIADQFELVEQGAAGIIRVYGTMPQIYSNMLRATYVAGFPVDWSNAGNGTTHRLPADLSRLCENLVIRFFKRRSVPGKTGETIEGATINWDSQMDALDRETIKSYTRVGEIF